MWPFYFNNNLAKEERAGCLLVAICVLCLFLTVLQVGVRSAIVAFPGQTHLLFDTNVDHDKKMC